MKAVLDWVKTNWLIVVMAALVVLLPVGGLIGSGIWQQRILASVEGEYESEKRRLSGAQRVSYVVPAITTDGQPIELSREPNASITRALAEERRRRLEQVERVVERAVELNRAGHEPLIEGLFGPDGALAQSQAGASPSQMGGRPGGPGRGGAQRARQPSGGAVPGPGAGQQPVQQPGQQPAGDGTSAAPSVDPVPLLAELRDVITGAERPRSAYEALFAEFNAGRPPDPAELAEQLRQRRELEESKIEGQPTDEERAAITETLRAVRMSRYRSAANRISIYASPAEVLELTAEEAESGRYSEIPISPETPRPEPAEAFVWQWDYWIVQDLLESIREADTGPTGLRVVPAAAGPDGEIVSPGSTVKRLETIRLEKLDLSQAAGATAGGMGGPPGGGFGGRGGGRGGRGGRGPAPAPAAAPSMGGGGDDDDPEDWPTSYTGHSNPGGGPYDVRRARLVAVVAADRVDDFIDTLTTRNLMTVIGMEVEAIEPWDELSAGYYYGPEPVVRVRLDLETVWLREWMAPLMPAQVRAALGVPPPDAG